jgi:methyltransferase
VTPAAIRTWLLLALVFVAMLIEALRAARNERTQRRAGGVEASGDVYSLMRMAYPTAFLMMIAEGHFRGAPSAGVQMAGLAILALGKAVKWWAIIELGSAWTFRVIVVPGRPLVTSGPYRFLRHPNYVGVIGELVGVALVANAPISGSLATLSFGWLIAKRVAVENRALGAILRRV